MVMFSSETPLFTRSFPNLAQNALMQTRNFMASFLEHQVGVAPADSEANAAVQHMTMSEKKEAASNEEYFIVCHIASFCFVFIVSAVLTGLLGLIPRFRPPVSVTLFVAGMAIVPIVHLSNINTLSYGLTVIEKIDPLLILFVFLPICLYESASRINFYTFKQVLPASLLLAIPGVAINVAFVATFVRYAIGSPYDWPTALMLASILSATDPVAVIASLKALGAPERLSSVVEGESLLNDGSAVVFFQVFRSLIVGSFKGFGTSCLYFIQLSLGGTAYGILGGLIVFLWFYSFSSLFLVQVTGLIAVVYTLFFTADHILHISGVLAVASFGLFMSARGSVGLHRTVQELHLGAVEFLATLCNQAIFVCGGIITSRYLGEFAGSWHAWLEMLSIYFVLLASRFIIVLSFLPIMNWFGTPFNVKESLVLFYGGLRGVVCLALSLAVEGDERISEARREHVGLAIAGTVLFTMLINGTTTELFYKALNMYPVTEYRRVYLTKSMKVIDEEYAERANELRSHWAFVGTTSLECADGLVPKFSDGHVSTSGQLFLKKLKTKDVYANLPSYALWTPPGLDANEEQPIMVKLPTVMHDWNPSELVTAFLRLRPEQTDSPRTLIPESEDSKDVADEKKPLVFHIQVQSLTDNEQQVLLCNMILNASQQHYMLMFEHCTITGGALMLLKESISEAKAFGESLLRPDPKVKQEKKGRSSRWTFISLMSDESKA